MTTEQVNVREWNESGYETVSADGVASAEVAFGELGEEALQHIAGGSFWDKVTNFASKAGSVAADVGEDALKTAAQTY